MDKFFDQTGKLWPVHNSSISGDKRSLEVAADEVLRLTDENEAAYWDFEVERANPIYALGLQSFAITQSGRGVPSGPNSDTKNDLVSEQHLSKKLF
ncbi:hypothetical protein EON65_28605 [archaeon]|nr:MAG: hypothetical protein EON65_28605 [archaeon]